LQRLCVVGMEHMLVQGRKARDNKTDPDVLLSFCKASLEMTCPQAIIIGGFDSVDCSFDTRQVKMEWYLLSGGSGISIYEHGHQY
jgi:hypothetical protein